MSNQNFQVKEQIKEQLKTLPQLPGIYIMKDINGEIIYVGKAKNLKNRVSSYFRGFNSHLPKTQTMVINIHDFDYIMTDSEMEALILEANLIKKHLPRFNILLKDDKMYPYIVISIGENFPRVFMTRQIPKGNFKVFGPFTSTEQVRLTLEVIQTLFPIRECSKKITDKIDRPCLNYHIGRCAGACNHMITEEAYSVYIQQIIRFLSGDKEWLIKELGEKMLRSAEKMAFEEAAVFRDKIAALKALNEKQKAIQINGKNQDYIAAYSFEERACVMLFQVRNGKIEGRESYNLINAEATTESELLSSFILQYYSGSDQVPGEIYVSHEIENMSLFGDWLSKLSGYKVGFSLPIRGEKKKTIDLVLRNAKEYIMKFQDRIDKELEFKALAEAELKLLLGFPENLKINRIEAFDISNISGVYSVGSMVVFEGAKKKRSDYRRYRVRTIEGANDYGSMQEVVYRRYKRGLEEKQIAEETGIIDPKYNALPDLILIDGGKGHVNAVLEILNALQLFIPVAGMVKDDFHKTEDLFYDGERRGLKNANSAFKLVYEIQEEVHRFAIEYHKSLRSKEMTYSILDEIDGVGEKRRIELLKHFKTIDAIKDATVEDLASVKGLNKKVATSIFNAFHAVMEVETEN
jgi:excinuclease ABC subunit C